MNIFRHRPLFLGCSVCMGAIAIGYALPRLMAGWSMLLFLLGAVIALACGMRFMATRPRALTLAICLLLSAASLLRTYTTLDGGRPITPLADLEPSTARVTGVITDRRGSGDYITSYAIAVDSVNGIQTDGLALLTCHYVSDLQPGYSVEMDVTVISLEAAAGDGYDASALVGDGYCAGLLSESEETVHIRHMDVESPAVWIGRWRRTLAARLNELTAPRVLSDGVLEAHGLPSALLLGDKTALSPTIRRDFARTGVSHILAISGLHMTLLFGLLAGLLQLLRIPKRWRAMLLLVGAIGYLILLGFPPSATRAVIMLGITYLAHLLSARADPLTSLGVAGALILLVTPYAVADAGFWMSYLATFGLLTLMPPINEWIRGRHASRPLAILLKGLAGLAVGVVAMTFTLFITASVIGELGILSPIATLLLTPLTAVVLIVSLLALPLSGTAAGPFLAEILRRTCTLMGHLAAWMAKPSWAVISLRHPAILPIAAAMTAGLLILLAVRLPARRRWMVGLPILAGWLAVGGVLGAHTVNRSGTVTATYLQPSSVSDALVLVEGHEGVICDLSNGSLTAMNTAVREAEQNGATEIAVLMLTHYHTRTVGTLADLLARETVRAVWAPRPTTAEDYYLLLAYVEKAADAGVELVLYDTGDALRVFGDGILTLEQTRIERSTQPVLLLSLDTAPDIAGSGRLIYVGSAIFESDLSSRAGALIADADAVIFGNHGPLVKAPFGADLSFRPHAQIILSEKGDVAAYLDPQKLPANPDLWLGQRRMVLKIQGSPEPIAP